MKNSYSLLRNDQDAWIKLFTLVQWIVELDSRTGFYVIFKGDLTSHDIINIVIRMIDFILDFNGNIPGASPKDCGNYLDMNLEIAKYYCDIFKKEVLDNIRGEILNYPK